MCNLTCICIFFSLSASGPALPDLMVWPGMADCVSPPRPHTCQSCHSVLSHWSAAPLGGLFYDKKPAWRRPALKPALQEITHWYHLHGCAEYTKTRKMSFPFIWWFFFFAPWCLNRASFLYKSAKKYRIFYSGRGWWGLGGKWGWELGEKMNMYVHIYPENDYLLKHSLIGFHNSFCAYSLFYWI